MADANGCAVVLVTGATGFVGKALVRSLSEDPSFRVRAASRQSISFDNTIDSVASGDLGGSTDWSRALDGVTAVVHLAARVHVMRERSADPLTEFRKANVDGTLALARQAAAAGVKRFVFLSSVKVNGEKTDDHAFSERDQPRPADPYGVSKHEAELGLLRIGKETTMQVVIVRAPLIYGPGVKANFRRMMSWLHRGLPLPFGAIDNRRTLIGLDNLVDLLRTCLIRPRAANQTFLAGDDEDLSTTDLLRRLGLALGTPARLIPVPPRVLRFGLATLGLGEEAQRLCGSLQVDSSRARALLDWHPPATVDAGLRKTAADFLATISQRNDDKAA